jgi:UDP-4-amino-4,6-dideoxy-N-acetyl-beta-L-altrosamine transaminase
MNNIPYGRQFISEEDIEAVKNVLVSDYLTQGPAVKAFEASFGNYVGAKYAVAVCNGTAALHLSALALGVNENSNVITTPITFSASANCIKYAGGKIHFADIDAQTGLLSVESVRSLIEQHPKGTFQGIIPVDYAGYPVPMDDFRRLADEHGLWLIEDACHAAGGAFTTQTKLRHRCGDGSLAECAVFSFHPVKHIATGEGGIITTNSEILYNKLLRLRTHGIVGQGHPDLIENEGGWYMEMQELGYNYRLSDIQAALGISQLKRADQNITRRKEIAKKYDEAFENTAIKTIVPGKLIEHAYHLYVIRIEDRKGLYDFLRTKNIFAQVHYIPVHLMPYYRNLGFRKGDFPIAENFYAHCLSIPMYPTLTDQEQDCVIENIISFVNG